MKIQELENNYKHPSEDKSNQLKYRFYWFTVAVQTDDPKVPEFVTKFRRTLEELLGEIEDLFLSNSQMIITVGSSFTDKDGLEKKFENQDGRSS